MKSLIESLHHTCQKNVFDEKILVVDSYAIGEQILFQLMKQGHQAINLKIKTVRDLAMETSETHNDYINRAIGSHLLYSLLKKLKSDDKLAYFHELEVTPALSQGVYDIIQELRLAGYKSELLSEKSFVSIKKGEDIILVLREYEQMLQHHQLKDDFMLFHEAIEKGKQSKAIFLLQNNLQLTDLQEQFLETFLPTIVIHLPLAPVFGMKQPYQSNDGESTPLSYLYDPENVNVKGHEVKMSLFTTKTEEHELKEVIGQIARHPFRFDDCVLLYSQRNPYITAMYHLAEVQQVPVTFSKGIPICFTRPGKLVKAFLNWMKESYSVRSFVILLQEGLLDSGEEGPSKMRWTALLRSTRIGWGETRYASQLQAEIEKVEEKLKTVEEEEKRVYLEVLHKDLSWLFTWYRTIFESLPKIRSQKDLEYEALLRGLKHIVKEHSKVNGAYDQAAKESLLDKIDTIIPYANEKVTIEEGMYKIEELVLSISVGASLPKPGHLHMANYEEGVYVSRENVFIVGLDNQRFPGDSKENPLLLDVERQRLGKRIPLLSEKSKDKRYRMLQVLASSSGHVTLSYCQFDVNENRLVSPSHLFLQCYRFQSGEKEADFDRLKQALPVKDTSLTSQKDWWSTKLTTTSEITIEPILLDEFPHIVMGLQAEKTRETSSFTVYDGKIESDTSMHDPRKNKEKTISAGKLETLATCPYKFYLQEILKIKPVEEVEYDHNQWLDPATRGSLLHEIFETFYVELQIRSEKPSMDVHHQFIQQIARNSLEKIKTHVPPPNNKVEFQETEEIIESCETFLKIEEENSIHGDPKYFEYTFGVNGEEAATITLPSGSFRVAGKIDRVDQLYDNTYHIIDYKTGSTWGYDKNSSFKGGRQLQHLLYTLAIENHLALGEGAVQKSTYLFPTKKGLGQSFERVQEETLRTNGRDILDKLLSVIEHGHFAMTDDSNDCKFCDYKSVCRRSTYDNDHIDLKHQDKTSIGVRSFKGVRAYD
ncbi:PD-(D/E)XK nuclease family protein [Salipaludibacillus daqingensis]|uniref:PD-(D/E)XK nuclease family protein n=1 Tax=Salipaludibacillus daqingensis TaxID=3041001 RepID=UPI002473E60D|nr:PD-(D/E)XK nuclease family protein [Salipaludibacillus daqingensis]